MMNNEENRSGTVLFAIGFILLAIACMMLFLWHNDYEAAKAELLNQNATIEAPGEVQAEATPEPVVLNSEEITSAYEAAQNAANDAAVLQNREYEAYMSISKDESTREASHEIIMDSLANLGNYFGSGSVYCEPWFWSDPDIKGITWTTYVGLDYTGNFVPVYWLCRDVNDNVLSYVTGNYNATTNTFTGMSKGTTTLGMKSAAVTKDAPEEAPENYALESDQDTQAFIDGVNALVDQIQQQGGVSESEEYHTATSSKTGGDN